MNNEIKLPVSELKTALAGLNKIVCRKTTLPVLQNVKVSRQRNGLVTLQATDLDAFATYTLTGTQSGAATELLMPFEQLTKAFKCSGPKDDVTLVCDGSKAKIRYALAGSQVEQPVILTPVNEWPPLPEIKANSFKLGPEFGSALKQALASCSEDPSRYVLHGACLDVEDKKNHYVVGTNGRALFAANTFAFPITKSVIIPDSKFLEAGDLLDDEPCYLSVQPGKGKDSVSQVCLQTARWTFITKEIDGKFPNWKQVVPTQTEKWTVVKLSTDSVKQLLQVVPKLPCDDDSNWTVRLRIGTDLRVEGRSKDDKEWTSIQIKDVKITGRSITTHLNRNYLVQAMKFGLDEFAVENELTPLVFTKQGKKFVVMPIRREGTTAPKPQPEAAKPPVPAPPPTPPKPVVVQTPQPKTERKTMPRTASTPTPDTSTAKTESPFKTAFTQVNNIKAALKHLIKELAGVAKSLKKAGKEKRATEKEIQAVRTTLRRIQNVKI